MSINFKKILINHNHWQTRVAVLRNDNLQDIFFDSNIREYIEHCFFKGKISKILPGIQTAFVDIDQARAGFLHITEIDRTLAANRIAKQTGEKITISLVKHQMNIEKVLKEVENILVKVLK